MITSFRWATSTHSTVPAPAGTARAAGATPHDIASNDEHRELAGALHATRATRPGRTWPLHRRSGRPILADAQVHATLAHAAATALSQAADARAWTAAAGTWLSG